MTIPIWKDQWAFEDLIRPLASTAGSRRNDRSKLIGSGEMVSCINA